MSNKLLVLSNDSKTHSQHFYKSKTDARTENVRKNKLCAVKYLLMFMCVLGQGVTTTNISCSLKIMHALATAVHCLLELDDSIRWFCY